MTFIVYLLAQAWHSCDLKMSITSCNGLNARLPITSAAMAMNARNIKLKVVWFIGQVLLPPGREVCSVSQKSARCKPEMGQRWLIVEVSVVLLVQWAGCGIVTSTMMHKESLASLAQVNHLINQHSCDGCSRRTRSTECKQEHLLARTLGQYSSMTPTNTRQLRKEHINSHEACVHCNSALSNTNRKKKLISLIMQRLWMDHHLHSHNCPLAMHHMHLKEKSCVNLILKHYKKFDCLLESKNIANLMYLNFASKRLTMLVLKP